MSKLTIPDIVRKDLKSLKTAQAAGRYKNEVFAPQSVRRTTLRTMTKRAAQTGAKSGLLTKAVSKIAVPVALGYETYNTGKKAVEYVKGLRDYNKDTKNWVSQSTKQADATIALLKERRKKRLATTQ